MGTSDLFRGTGAHGSELHIFVPWSKLAIRINNTHLYKGRRMVSNVLVQPVGPVASVQCVLITLL